MSFVTNSWYVAAWAHEIPVDRPMTLRLLNQPLVLFRDDTGQVRALEDRCPHRGVPLGMGSIHQGAIQCIYHGLRFNGNGACIHNPHLQGDPGRLSVRSYPVAERHGAIWVWPGRPELADTARIPDYGVFDAGRSDYRVVHGYMHVRANVQLVIDNLLDLSHAEYLHANTVGTPGSAGSVSNSVSAGELSVTVHRKVFDLQPSAVFKPLWTATERIDQQSDMTWHAASSLFLDLGIMPPGGQLQQGFHFPSAHLLAPETDRSTHYFYAVARSFSLDDDTLDERIRATFQRAFGEEDRPVIEALQVSLDEAPKSFRMVDFTSGDGAATRVRRILDRLAHEC